MRFLVILCRFERSGIKDDEREIFCIKNSLTQSPNFPIKKKKKKEQNATSPTLYGKNNFIIFS
jgi:hypothetical protein